MSLRLSFQPLSMHPCILEVYGLIRRWGEFAAAKGAKAGSLAGGQEWSRYLSRRTDSVSVGYLSGDCESMMRSDYP
jgi:hypothetical protein